MRRGGCAAVSVNLSSVYLQLGQLEAAAEVANRALTTEIRNQRQFRSKLLIQAGLLKLAQGEGVAGEHLLLDAVDEAHKQHDAGSEAQALNELGNALLDSGQTERAERAQLEGLQLRVRNADDRIYFSYQSLGKVRARQGDLLGAIKLFDRAIDAARHANVRFRLWTAHYERGEVKLALGRAEEAYADLRIALGFARRWRAQVLPADVFRVSMSLQLDEIYSAFIDAGNLLYRQNGRKNYLQETFAAAEDHRAASLRGLRTVRRGGPAVCRRNTGKPFRSCTPLRQSFPIATAGPLRKPSVSFGSGWPKWKPPRVSICR